MKRHLTIVIPVHNEEPNVGPLYDRLEAVLSGLKDWTCSVLFVDDGSRDQTVERIRELRARGKPVGYLRLTKNFGHQAALEAGLLAAKGDAVITMDGDLQHPPEEIPRMVQHFEQGYDVVQMARRNPQAGKKGLFSRLFYWFFAQVAESEIVPDASDYRLVSRRVIEVLRRIPEREKFFRALIPSLGFPQAVLTYEEADRWAGKPAYRFRTSWKLATRALLGYSHFPLVFVFWMGLGLAVVSFVTGVGHIIVRLLYAHRVVPGFTDIITGVLFLGGCTLATLGVIGRYMIIILEQVRGRPVYLIAEQVDCPDPVQTPDAP